MLGAVGACVGSFLNVVAYRLPRACMSVVRPSSRCPRCSQGIRAWENIPILSWLFLRGRCSGCALPISPRYPLVELVTALLFVLLGVCLLSAQTLRQPVAGGTEWLTWGVYALITSVLIALSLIDYDYKILPDVLTKSGIILGPLLAFLAPGLQHERFMFKVMEQGAWAPRVNALCNGIVGGMLAAGILYGIGWLGSKAFKKQAMGFGDVKMMGAMGGVQGAWALLSLLVGSVLGAIVGTLVRLISKKQYIPFGPFLAIGMFAVILWGPRILQTYLDLFVFK